MREEADHKNKITTVNLFQEEAAPAEQVETIGSVSDDIRAVAGDAVAQVSEAVSAASKAVTETVMSAEESVASKAKDVSVAITEKTEAAEAALKDVVKDTASAASDKAAAAEEILKETAKAASEKVEVVEEAVKEKAADVQAAFVTVTSGSEVAVEPQRTVCSSLAAYSGDPPNIDDDKPAAVSSSVSTTAAPYPPQQEVVEEPFVQTSRETIVLDRAVSASPTDDQPSPVVEEAVKDLAAATLDAAAVKNIVSEIESPPATPSASTNPTTPPTFFEEILESTSAVELKSTAARRYTPEPEQEPILEELIMPQVAKLTYDEVEVIGKIMDEEVTHKTSGGSFCGVVDYTPSPYREESPVKRTTTTTAEVDLKDFLENPPKSRTPSPPKSIPASPKIKDSPPVFTKEDSPVFEKELSPVLDKEEPLKRPDSPLLVREDSPAPPSPSSKKEDSPADKKEDSPPAEASIVKLKNFLEQSPPASPTPVAAEVSSLVAAAVKTDLADVETVGSIEDVATSSVEDKAVDKL